MPDEKPVIHIRIRELRRDRSLTQEELAGALGISRQSVNAMEAGRCLPSLPVALQIASYFSVPLATVFEFPEALAARMVQEQSQAVENALMPWSPIREMQEAFNGLNTSWQTETETSVPPINIFQTASHVIAEVYLPGFDKENLSIDVGDDFLTVAGQTEQFSYVDRQFFLQEYVMTSFQRTVPLPLIVQGERAEAEMRQGVLTIKIPKTVEEKPKSSRINIRSAE